MPIKQLMLQSKADMHMKLALKLFRSLILIKLFSNSKVNV